MIFVTYTRKVSNQKFLVVAAVNFCLILALMVALNYKALICDFAIFSYQQKWYNQAKALLLSCQNRQSVDLLSAKVDYWLGKTEYQIGEDSQAEIYFRFAMQTRKQLLGPLHDDSAASVYGLVNSLEALNRSDEAQSLLEDLLTERRTHQASNINTALAANALGGWYLAHGKRRRAAELFSEAIAHKSVDKDSLLCKHLRANLARAEVSQCRADGI